MLNVCWTSWLSPRLKHVYICGCPGSNMGHWKWRCWIWWCGSMFIFCWTNPTNLCKGYGLVGHESFCIVTNEGGALISVGNLAVVVNTNICIWVTHSGRCLDEYLKVIQMSSSSSWIIGLLKIAKISIGQKMLSIVRFC